jgi:hypothetical protein
LITNPTENTCPRQEEKPALGVSQPDYSVIYQTTFSPVEKGGVKNSIYVYVYRGGYVYLYILPKKIEAI